MALAYHEGVGFFKKQMPGVAQGIGTSSLSSWLERQNQPGWNLDSSLAQSKQVLAGACDICITTAWRLCRCSPEPATLPTPRNLSNGHQSTFLILCSPWSPWDGTARLCPNSWYLPQLTSLSWCGLSLGPIHLNCHQWTTPLPFTTASPGMCLCLWPHLAYSSVPTSVSLGNSDIVWGNYHLLLASLTPFCERQGFSHWLSTLYMRSHCPKDVNFS